ncbi:hypothetical protein NU195Hw_g5994t1 [Hortaea werneckii]
MVNIVSSSDTYGPGSYTDLSPPTVQEDARRVFELLAAKTPGFTQDRKLLDAVSFHGSPDTIVPGPLKSGVVASALHAMCGVAANEVLALRDGSGSKDVSIDTDHASFWLGSVGMPERHGRTVREIAKAGELASIFDTDLEKDTFATPLKLRATANYPTKDPSVWYQLHGSLNAEPVLRIIGLNPEQPCRDNDEAYRIIADRVKQYDANQLEMLNVANGLCGSICYTPKEWSETRMSQDLSRHPLINCSQETYAQPTPAVPLPKTMSDKRPLAGIKVVELVRIIAGPVIGTTLASLGADVIRVNSSALPDFNSLQLSLNAGVRTVDADLRSKKDLERVLELIDGADIFIQGYRPGVLARKGLSLHNLLERASKRGKGIVYVEESCYGPNGPMNERPGWQQVADAASGCSYVTGRSLGYNDGTSILPALPVPDMMTGLIGAIGAVMAIRDRATKGGSYHVQAALMAAAAYLVDKEVGLYPPEVVKKCDAKFQWDTSGPDQFVLELLDIGLKGWKNVFPEKFGDNSPILSEQKGDWGTFRVLKPVAQLANKEVSPHYTTAPEPNCKRHVGEIAFA